MNIEAALMQFLKSEILSDNQSSELTDESALVSSGRVDSMGLLQILGFIQQRFGVDLMAVGTPHDFDSIMALASAVRRSTSDG